MIKFGRKPMVMVGRTPVANSEAQRVRLEMDREDVQALLTVSWRAANKLSAPMMGDRDEERAHRELLRQGHAKYYGYWSTQRYDDLLKSYFCEEETAAKE